MSKPVDPTECPECGHKSVYTTSYLRETMIDPEAWMGRCTCTDGHIDSQDVLTEDCCKCEWES